MTFLVDANVPSEATSPEPDPEVVEWLRRHEREIAFDSVVLGELKFGTLLLPRGKRRTRIERWSASRVQQIQCIPWEAATGLRWARLLADLRASGESLPIKDSLIAATALVHGIPVATWNRSDFEKAGAEVVDPFS